MLTFRSFLEADQNQKDFNDILNKLPKKHQSLVKNYKVKFQKNNTLNGDEKHVGYVDTDKEEVVIAAPWNYGRCFVILHEIAHLVYETLSQEQKNKWKEIAGKIKDKPIKNIEEFFCMIYANNFIKHKVKTYDYPSLYKFIDRL